MLTTISWRNVWRSRTRSLTVIFSIVLGLWAALFLIAFSLGMNGQRARYMIENQLSHIQLHDPRFKDDREVELIVPHGQEILDSLRQQPEVLSASGRVLINGMIASSKTGAGVQIYGVDKEAEKAQIHLDEKLVEGEYFEGISRNPILIGKKLAEKLRVDLRKKIVLTFQDTHGEIVSGAFRVAGIYRTINSKYDEGTVFVQREDLDRLLGNQGALNEIAITLRNPERVPEVKQELTQEYPNVLVESWGDLAPDLQLMEESFDTYMRIFLMIIMLALAFGIINTMQMAVLERRHELGMLMAVGMNKFRIFAMIMLETVFFAMIGGPVGLLLAYLTIAYFGNVGIDLSVFSEGLSSFGMDNIVYPEVTANYYVETAFLVIITALLSAIFPAIRALRLNPTEAIRAL